MSLWYVERPLPVDGPDQHAELIAREAEEDALRGSLPLCRCFDVESMEYDPAGPCDYCKRQALTEIDVDGLDDKRETPGLVA